MHVAEALGLLCPKIKDVAGQVEGASYSSVRAWRRGDRTPSPEHLRQIATIAQERSGQLSRIAARLELDAERMEGERGSREASLNHRDDCMATERGESCAPAEGDWNQPSGHYVREARSQLQDELGDEPPWCRIHERAWQLIEAEEGES